MQLRLMLCSAGLGVLLAGAMSANTGGVIHRPSGRLYVVSGTEATRDLQKQAQTACQQKEGVAGDPKRSHECVIMKNLPSGPCDAAYGKGFQTVTVGGFQWQKVPGYTGFLHCGKNQADSDKEFQKHCSSPGCTVWQHYTDQYNQ